MPNMHPEEEPLLRQTWIPNSHSHHLPRSWSNYIKTLGSLADTVANAFRIVMAPSSQWGRKRKVPAMIIAIATVTMEIIFQTKGITYLTTNLRRPWPMLITSISPKILQTLGSLAWVLAQTEFKTHVQLTLKKGGVDFRERNGAFDGSRKNSFGTLMEQLLLKAPVIYCSLCQVSQPNLGLLRAIPFAGLSFILNAGFRLACGQTRGVLENWICELECNKDL